MSFVTPLFLGLALTALVVVLLHTLHRQRRAVGSVMLWRQLALDSLPRRSLRLPKPNLLMLLQVLAVLLIALALAQPRLAGGERAALHHVFVLDISASMGTHDAGGSRFEAAQAALAEDLGRLELDKGDRVSVIAAGATPQLLAVRHDTAAAAGALVASMAVTDGGADWRATAGVLPAIMNEGEDARLVILTDDADGAALVEPDLSPRIRSFGDPATQNAAVTARLLPDPDDPAHWLLQGQVRLHGMTEAPPLSLRFRPEGSTTFLEWEAPAYAPADGETVPFSASLDLPRPGLLELTLPPDAAPFDDRFFLVVPDPDERLQVLYVGPGNPAVQAALLAGGRTEVFAATALPADTGDYDLVVLDSAVLPAPPTGNLLWLGSARVEDDPAPTLSGALINSWDSEHALSHGIDWAGLDEMRAFDGALLPGARSIVSAGRVPLVQARTRPEGRELRITLDPADPSWTGAPQFPLLIGNLIDWLFPATGACIAGHLCPVPAQSLTATIMSPAGTPVLRPADLGTEILPEALAGGFIPLHAGIYTDGTRLYPVNADPAESVAAVPAPPVPTEAHARAGWPLHRWLLVAALALILLETGIALSRSEARLALTTGTLEATRQKFALVLRAGTLALGLAALADAPFLQFGPAEQIVVIAPAQDLTQSDAGVELVSDMQSRCSMIPAQTAGLVTAGAPPHVVQDLSCDAGTGHITLPAPAFGSDLGLGLELALAMMQPDKDGRIVLVGDVPQTGGAPQRGTEALVKAGVRLDLLPLPRSVQGDAWVADIAVPEGLFAGDTAPLTAIIHSDVDTNAQIEIGQDDQTLLSQEMPLSAGANRIDTTVPDLTEGVTRLWVRVTAPNDPQPLNDMNAVLRDVAPAPRIAIVTPEADRGEIMADALAVQGLEATVLRPDRAPFWLSGWLNYDGVILMNVPALDLDTRQQEQMADFAGLHGRGLMILGGENSFGPGGYFQTLLEAVSPLSAQIPREAPVAGIAFVLDRSGSMQAPVEGVSRLDIAKEATMAAIRLLNAESQVAIVVFDTESHVILPLQERLDLDAAEQALAPIVPGGGTSIAPGLEAALDELDRSDAAVRHIVVMSDGLTQPGDFEGLMARANAGGITVSTVSIGAGADVGRLADLARAGGGSSHVTRDFRALPGILSQEAMMLGGEPMQHGPTAVVWDDRTAPGLSGLPEMPPVDSWVRTTLKPGAQQHLALNDTEGNVVPILASWRYGNGTVLALASHAVGPGTMRWQMQPHFPLLYAQAMRAMLSARETDLSLDIRRLDDTLAIHTAALSETGELMPDIPLTATLWQDDSAVPVQLTPGEGGWSGRSASLQPGDWRFVIEGEDISAEASGTIAYSASLDHSRGDPGLLANISAITGGQMLAAGDELRWPGQTLRLAPGWQYWALLALAAFLLDLTVRYVPGLFAGLRRVVGSGLTRRSVA